MSGTYQVHHPHDSDESVLLRMKEDVVCLASLTALFINAVCVGSLNCSGKN